MTDEDIRKDILSLLLEHFEGDKGKVDAWLISRNPGLSGSSPILLMRTGRGIKVLLFIKSALEENKR